MHLFVIHYAFQLLAIVQTKIAFCQPLYADNTVLNLCIHKAAFRCLSTAKLKN
jgi:hypothetical protein